MSLPQHIALIPDGNRRWARKRGKLAAYGHWAGVKNFERILRSTFELGIPYVTFWGLSVNNVLKRSKTEVAVLFKIFEKSFNAVAKNKDIHSNGVRITVLGRWEEFFPTKTKRAIKNMMDATAKYDNYRLTFLMAYSGIDEMLAAIKSISSTKHKNMKTAINEALVKKHLWTHALPPVDLVIRTGGEPHWSMGFMMWDVAEAQLAFTKTLWPAFSPEELQLIVRQYKKTQRRKGK